MGGLTRGSILISIRVSRAILLFRCGQRRRAPDGWFDTLRPDARWFQIIEWGFSRSAANTTASEVATVTVQSVPPVHYSTDGPVGAAASAPRSCSGRPAARPGRAGCRRAGPGAGTLQPRKSGSHARPSSTPPPPASASRWPAITGRLARWSRVMVTGCAGCRGTAVSDPEPRAGRLCR